MSSYHSHEPLWESIPVSVLNQHRNNIIICLYLRHILSHVLINIITECCIFVVSKGKTVYEISWFLVKMYITKLHLYPIDHRKMSLIDAKLSYTLKQFCNEMNQPACWPLGQNDFPKAEWLRCWAGKQQVGQLCSFFTPNQLVVDEVIKR